MAQTLEPLERRRKRGEKQGDKGGTPSDTSDAYEGRATGTQPTPAFHSIHSASRITRVPQPIPSPSGSCQASRATF